MTGDLNAVNVIMRIAVLLRLPGLAAEKDIPFHGKIPPSPCN
jgi:hypothetical protein